MERVQPETTMPRSKAIKVYTALVDQDAASIPTAIILQNTTGITPTWTRFGAGVYGLEFPDTIPDITKVAATVNSAGAICGANCEDPDNILIITTAHTGTNSDSLLYKATIEIKIYE